MPSASRPLSEPARQRRFLLLAAALFPLAVRAEGPGPDGEGAPSPSQGYPVSLAQLQQAVAPRFPRRYPVSGLLNVDLMAPKLACLPQENRLRAELPLEVAGPALNRRHEGSFDVDFGLRYEASDRTVRAHQLRLHRLRFPTLRPNVVELLEMYIPALVDQSLQEVVLHELRPQDLRMLDVMGMQPGNITVTETGLRIGLVPKALS